MGKTFQCHVAVFTGPETVQQVVLPDGHRFVVIRRGYEPTVEDIDSPGEYEVDASHLGGEEYPIGLCVIDLAHVPAWLALNKRQVGRMITRIERKVAEVRAAPRPPRSRGGAVKLSKAQWSFLAEIAVRPQIVIESYKPALKLKELDLATARPNSFGTLRVEITPAGRAALATKELADAR